MKYYIKAIKRDNHCQKFLFPSFYEKKFYQYQESDRLPGIAFNTIKAAEKYVKWMKDSWIEEYYTNFKIVTGIGEEVKSIDQEICSLLGELMERKLRFGQILENIKVEQGDLFYKRNDELRDSLKNMLEVTHVEIRDRSR